MHLLKNNFLLSVLSSALLVFAFPYSGSLTPLIFVAWIPLWFVALNLQNNKRGALKFFGFSYGSMLLFNVGTTWWIWNSTQSGAIMAFATNSLLMAGGLSLAFYLFKSLHKALFLGGMSLAWISFEFFHLNWELSWPWLTMGNFFAIRTSWVQWYEYTGILGGSFWVMAVSVFVTLVLSSRKAWGAGIVVLSLLVTPYILSVAIHPANNHPKKPLQHVVLLQPNLDPFLVKFTTDPIDQLNEMVTMAKPYLTNQSLVVGPETAIQELFVESDFKTTQSYQVLAKACNDSNITVLIGASTAKIFDNKHSSASVPLPNGGFYETYNTSLFYSNDQALFIHKSKLVPGTESIPFIQWFPFLGTLTLGNGGASGSLGVENEPKVFKQGAKVYAPIICYESIYGSFVGKQCMKGAQLLVIMTNDGWWGNTPGHRQHNSFAALRAIETRKYVVRSGNTGISSVWAPDGTCLNQLSYGKKGTLTAYVPLLNGYTFYAQHGDYLGWVAVIGLTLMGLWALIFRVKSRK